MSLFSQLIKLSLYFLYHLINGLYVECGFGHGLKLESCIHWRNSIDQPTHSLQGWSKKQIVIYLKTLKSFFLPSPLSHIVKFCCYWLVTVLLRNSWSPILGMGCRCQSPKFQTFSIMSLGEAKLQQIFALEFPQNCQSDKQKRPGVHSCSYQANSRSLGNTVTV